MKGKSIMVRIIKWLFEEDKNEEQSKANVEESYINLGPIQIVFLIAILGVFLLWIFFEPVKAFFYRPFSVHEYINRNIEKNYFRLNNKIKNSDFSMGMQHWVTSDGGTLFPDSKSIAVIENKDYHSAPASLKIECIAPASRYHYSKRVKNSVLNNAYSYKEPLCWMGVLAAKQLKASLWYKGDTVKFSVQYLKSDGKWDTLASETGQTSSQWSCLEINQKLPKDARAIMLEITLNQPQGMPLPIVLVDDINVEIK